MKLDINLATRRRPKAIIPYFLTALLVFVAVVYSLYNANDYRVNRKTISFLNARSLRGASGAAKERGTRPILTDGFPELGSEGDLKKIEKESALINDIIISRALSWTELLTVIEETLPGNVSIVGITPQFKEDAVLISGMAAGIGDVFKFINALSGVKGFGDVFLLKHSEEEKTNSAAGSSPTSSKERVFFKLSAEYKKGGVWKR